MTALRLRAGVAEMDITPKVGTELAGELYPRRSVGVCSSLKAKALVLSSGPTELAVVTLDLLGLHRPYADRAIGAVVDRCGLSAEGVMLVCSRTRGGPFTTFGLGRAELETRYLDGLVGQIVEVVTKAKDSLQDASLGLGHSLVPRLVFNRRLLTRNMKAVTEWIGVPRDEVLAPEGPTDPELSVLTVRDNKGRPICLLWNLASDDRFSIDDQISASLPGTVQEALDERVGQHLPAMCLTGCGGNVGYSLDSRRTTEDMASAIMAVQLETPCDPSIKLGCRREEMILPIRDYSRFWSEAEVELKWPEALDAFKQEVAWLQEEGANAVPTSVQAFRLGRFAIAALPGAPFVEFALRIKEESPFQSTLVVGNANDDPGYVITNDAFAHEGYESWPARSAKIGRGGGEFMAEEALSLLRELKRL